MVLWNALPEGLARLENSIGRAIVNAASAVESESEVTTHTVVISGLPPGKEYLLRVWVANDVGFNLESPPAVQCHTARRPLKPEDLEVEVVGPHAIFFSWVTVEPPEAPVQCCDVQVREDALIWSAWEDALGLETQTWSSTDVLHRHRWEQIIDSLRPSTSHVLRVHTKNEVDWSPWSEISAVSPSVPTVQDVATHYLQLDASAESGSFVLEFHVVDHAAALCALCFVTCLRTGAEVLATPLEGGRWAAVFPSASYPQQHVRFRVRAANAVGWSSIAEKTMLVDPVAGFPAVVGADSHAAALAKRCIESSQTPIQDTARRVLQLELARAHKLNSRFARLTREAEQSSRATRERIEVLRNRLECLQGTIQLLEDLKEDKPLDCPTRWNWPARCRELEELWAEQLAAARGASDERGANIPQESICTAVDILLAAGIWLERLDLEVLVPQWKAVLELAEQAQQAARIVRVWTAQHKAWSERFTKQRLSVWKDACITALHLVVAVDTGGDISATAEQVPEDLKACLALRTAIDSQSQKIQRVADLLRHIVGEDKRSQGFDEVSVMDKITQTGLGLVFTALLPVPGCVEVGVVSLGMLWLEADVAGRHVVMEHNQAQGAEAPFAKFRQRPSQTSRRMFQEWADNRLTRCALIHNATARVMTVKLLDGADSILARTYARIQDAHPMMRWVTGAVERSLAYAAHNMECTIEPTSVALLTFPEVDPEPEQEHAAAEGRESAHLAEVPGAPAPLQVEFAYGAGQHRERPVGRVAVRAGTALSFVCLCEELRVDNSEEHTESEQESSHREDGECEKARQTGDFTCGEPAEAHPCSSANELQDEAQSTNTVLVVNRDYAPITISFYGGSAHLGHFFDHPLLIVSLGPSEERTIALPAVPLEGEKGGAPSSSALPSHAATTEDASVEEEADAHEQPPPQEESPTPCEQRGASAPVQTEAMPASCEQPASSRWSTLAHLFQEHRNPQDAGILAASLAKGPWANTPPSKSAKTLYEVLVQSLGGRTWCNLRPGQELTYEGCL